jgi:hypothetical protein
MKGWFSDEWLARLNATHDAGVFLKSVELEESPSVTRYWVDADRTITYNGQTYTPMVMIWDGLGQAATFALPQVRVTVPNLLGEVTDYVESLDILGHRVVLRLLHLDLLSQVSDTDAITLEVLAIEGTLDRVTFLLGLDLSLRDYIPRDVMTKAEFPSIPDNLRRATIL